MIRAFERASITSDQRDAIINNTPDLFVPQIFSKNM